MKAKQENIMSRRRKYESGIKARVAVEAIKGEKTINELAGLYEVHPNQIGQWKKKLIKSAPEIFSGKKDREKEKTSEEKEQLYQRIGQLTMEVEYLKKKLGIEQ